MAAAEGTGDEVRAVVELLRGDEVVVLGAITCHRSGDLDVVDDLLRLDLLVARLGWRVRVREVCDRLREVADLVGVADKLDLSGPTASR
jgi:hypothetical protein